MYSTKFHLEQPGIELLNDLSEVRRHLGSVGDQIHLKFNKIRNFPQVNNSHLLITKTKGWHCRLFLQVGIEDWIIVASRENEMEVWVGLTDLSQIIQKR